ncbi:MAG: hypothetical protein WA642_10855 [Steroidobacteraceae bacterium]
MRYSIEKNTRPPNRQRRARTLPYLPTHRAENAASLIHALPLFLIDANGTAYFSDLTARTPGNCAADAPSALEINSAGRNDGSPVKFTLMAAFLMMI